MFCLQGIEVASIDFFNLKTFCHRLVSFAYFLKIPNRSWLRSFCLAWGLGGKISVRREKTRTRFEFSEPPGKAATVWQRERCKPIQLMKQKNVY